MKRVSALTEEEKAFVTEAYKNGNNHEIRNRAHCILLSSEGYSITEISKITDSYRKSVSGWIDRFNKDKSGCFVDSKRPGRPHSLTNEEEEIIVKEQITKHMGMSVMKSFILEKFGKTVSSDTIKRLYKKKARLEANAKIFETQA